MKGQPASRYEELVRNVRRWTERIHTVPPSLSTSNKLFIIQCSHIRENLGRQLRNVEDELQEWLMEQKTRLSASLRSDVKRVTAELQKELQNLHDFSKYAAMVRKSENMLPDMRQRLEYVLSLRDTICRSFGKTPEQEQILDEKLLCLWNRYVSLLKQAKSTVCQRLPPMAHAVDKMFSCLMSDLNQIVSDATSGPFLDPAQNATAMLTKLSIACRHVYTLNGKLQELSWTSENLRGRPLDLTVLPAAVQQVEARKKLWELLSLYKTWIREWKQRVFSEVIVSQAQVQVDGWQQQARSLTRTIPAHDPVLQETSLILESCSHQLKIMAKLQSPTLSHKHWRTIFQGMGLPEKRLTVAELMSQQLEDNYELINKICRDAKAEWDMEQAFLKFQQEWEAKVFQLDEFILPVRQHEVQLGLTCAEKPKQAVSNPQTASHHSYDAVTFTINGLEIHLAEIEDSLMVLSNMLNSPYSASFRSQVERWLQSFQELEKLLVIFERYQQSWAFLTTMFYEATTGAQRVDLLEQFQPVDETFREVMCSVSSDPHVVNIVRFQMTSDRCHGCSLCQILINDLSTMEALLKQMVNALHQQCPRLCFLSQREIIQLLSMDPKLSTLLPFVHRFFKGVRWLEVVGEVRTDAATDGTDVCLRHMKVVGIFGSLQEHITFPSPLEPNLSPLVWLHDLEKKLHATMVQLTKQCSVVRKQLEQFNQDLECKQKAGDVLSPNADRRRKGLPVLDLLSEYPLQCLLVAEEAAWCSAVVRAYQESSPAKLNSIKNYNSAKLKSLCLSIRDGISSATSQSLVSNYRMMCLRALVQLMMNHAQQLSRLKDVQGELDASFEWLTLMKYHIDSDAHSLKCSDLSTCYVDVLGNRLQYGYDYLGPEDAMMVSHPSTDRAILGILLALMSYRCGFVSGPRMSGKTKTVVHLGRAVGRQVFLLHCCPSMRPGVVQQMLLGALQTGMWLLLDSVDLLTYGVLSSLGEHLVEIHQFFSELMRKKEEVVYEAPKDRTTGGKTMVQPEFQMVFAGKSISANVNYGCVLTTSTRNTSEIPESLRAATRPVALTCPDYRIVAEVMLASSGFSEAVSLSRRLASLIKLAGDSLCLPDFINEDQSCYLVVLQKVIAASVIHLQLNARQHEALDVLDKQSFLEVSKKDADDNTVKPYRFMHSSPSSVVLWGLMEETAVVKALLSVLAPVIYQQKKASHFHMILKDTFPLACQFPFFQQYMVEEEKNLLKTAVTDELVRKGFHPDTQVTSCVLSLYQAIKASQVVTLIGPSGSGKTTCYRALAGALSRLADRRVEHTCEPETSASAWNSVDTVVLFPNAMSHEELFGCFCEESCWKDGAIPKVLRDSKCHDLTPSETCNQRKGVQKVKWLVMDGEPLGQPGWLDYLTTLCSLEDPFLCLPSGEKMTPSPSRLKLLVEATDLSDANPSAVTHCGLVHFTGTDLWKSVWKSEADALSTEHSLDQGTLKMWLRLAEDLFSSTLSSVRQRALTSAWHAEGEPCESPAYGLQEVMSFGRILRALLQHFGRRGTNATLTQTDGRDVPLHGTHIPVTEAQIQQELQDRNIFLVAYIWGFGGHLHPCHWQQFDSLARQLLFDSRYRIEVPDEESVFEHFFSVSSTSFPRSKNTQLANPTIPKYGKYAYLLDLMLEANQPVLLAGEAGSGKTSLCKTMVRFNRPHISLPASGLLSSTDLYGVLNAIASQRTCKAAMASKQSGLLLFVDDLHEAPCDVFGKMSKALETLRQCISKGGILTFDTYHLKFLSSRTISYMATCCVYGLSQTSTVMSSRLSRLFSIFVLPSLSTEVILSIQSSGLKIWLKDIPFVRNNADTAHRVITATKHLYDAVCERFQPTVQSPHFIFSHHDLWKVFRGMCQWRPNILNTQSCEKKARPVTPSSPHFPPATATLLNIVDLWMHECLRTFSDRLWSDDERKTLESLIENAATVNYEGMLLNLDGSAAATGPTTDTAGRHEAASSCPDTPNRDVTKASSCRTPAKPLVPFTTLKDGDAAMLSDGPNRSDEIKSDPMKGQTESRNVEDTSLDTVSVPPKLRQVTSKIICGPNLTEAVQPADQQRSFSRFSYEEQDLDVLVQWLSSFVDRKQEGNEDADSIMFRYVAHKQRLHQLLHILRALLVPRGHGVLLSSVTGTGRKTTVRLATSLMGCQLMELHPGNERKLLEILKEAGSRARADGVTVVILVHEDVSQSIRQQLLVAMAHGTCPGFHSDQDLKNLVSRMNAVTNSRRRLIDSQMLDKYLNHFNENVHVFLLFPLATSESSAIPASSTQGLKAQMMKALSLSCCVEAYQPWSNESLVEVAARCLKNGPYKLQREGLEASLAMAMAGIHQSARQYASVLLGAQPFSPQTYLELIHHFFYLCSCLNTHGQQQTKRLAAVLAHLDIMADTVKQYKTDVDRLQQIIAKTQQHEEELLRAEEDVGIQLEEARQKCVTEENKLYLLEEQIRLAQIQANPLFLSGLSILSCLNPADLEEVRHYRSPPEGVVKVMDAICLLFNRPFGWDSAKQLLGQPNFYQDLEFFDRYSLTNERLQQLGLIVHSPQFVPESVREVSQACESLCRWVQALYNFCIKPQAYSQEDKQNLELLAAKVRAHLQRARQHKEEVELHLQDVRLQLQSVRQDLEELRRRLREAEKREREAAAAADQVERHLRSWRAAAQEEEQNNQTLPGNSLLLAAVVSYFGPFGPETRTELLAKWRAFCQTGSIDLNPDDPRSSLLTDSDAAPPGPSFGFPIPLSDRLQSPLCRALGVNKQQVQDSLSARLLVQLMLWGCRRAFVQRWPLLAGENAEVDKEEEWSLVCADDPELLEKLHLAAEKGLRVLVTHVEHLTPTPQLLAMLKCRGDLLGSKQHVQRVHSEFCLFLSTQLPVRLLNLIHPSILAEVCVVDLSLTSEEMQQLMLTRLLQHDAAKLAIQHLQLQNSKWLLQEKMVEEEDALMDYILQSNAPLLQDPVFLPHVAVCQEAMQKLQVEIEQMGEELKYQDALLNGPRRVARLAAVLYWALQQVSHLSPAYFFSLHGFITMMHEALVDRGGPLVSYASGKVPEEVVSEVTHRMVAHLLVHFQPHLFRRHATVLKLLVSVALLQHDRLCSDAETAAFLRGFTGVESPVTKPASPSATSQHSLPGWIPPQIHSELLCLERIPAFRGLIASLAAAPKQWQEYLRFPSSTVTGTRALLWKTMVPHCLEGLVEDMAACHLCLSEQGSQSEQTRVLCRVVGGHDGPVILTLPGPGRDGQLNIQPLHFIKHLSCFMTDTNKVQVKFLSFGALRDRDFVLSTLDEAVTDGHWLVFNTCHLLDQWDHKVTAHLNQLMSSLKDEDEKKRIHPCFRLWFITQEQTSGSIPASVRLCGLPLICDAPRDVNEELSCSLHQVTSIIQPQSLQDATAENTELLLRCAIFHSVLLQRQTYEHSGRGNLYHWTQEDLLALVDANIHIVSLCQEKKKALQYVAVNLVHGGQVTDSADLGVVEGVAQACISAGSPLWDSRPHMFSNLIRNTGSFDLSGLLQILEYHVQNLVNISDPLVLGFGADVEDEIIKINSHNLNILLSDSQTPPGRLRRSIGELSHAAMMPDYGRTRDGLQALKSFLTHRNDGAVKDGGAVRHGPLHDFLQAEWDDLTDLVSSLLSQLQQTIQHNTPTAASLLRLANLSGLERRAELLSSYLWDDTTTDPPAAYRLSAFRNAKGFLVAVMREAAQLKRKYLSDIALHFQVLSVFRSPASLPVDAVYLCGLELRGALWDTRLGVLQDTLSPQPCLLPLLAVQAHVTNTNTSQRNASGSDGVQVSSASPSHAPQLPVYHCPLCVDGEWGSGTAGLTDANIVTTVPLHAKLHPVLCNLRRVRIVSTL
ncbi:hypothetical protein LDENG_00044700 [Lucifuga dentata]|nr:hypothetical protein LDENG_00044700 [Lucifuga dentata]